MDKITKANEILYNMNLLNILKKYGEVYIVGSYKMNLMAWNDIDIYVDNQTMDLEKLYNLSMEIFKTFNPIWFEGKQEECKVKGANYFLGFETTCTRELWNIDIWFFSKETINNTIKYNDNIIDIIKDNPNMRMIITDLKKQLINSGVYGTQYSSIDVYDAVIKGKVKNVNQFFDWYRNK